jgi:hypothetical protein
MIDQVKIKPIQWMADVREGVLANSEKRMPKWRFRLTPDVLALIQPKPVSLLTPRALELGCKQLVLKFEGVAVMSENATPGMLDGKRQPGIAGCKVTFEIIAESPDDWTIRRRSGSWTRSLGRESYDLLFSRVVGALSNGFFEELTEQKLLSHFCFQCGKPLTDPASMARRIGPECAGTSSLYVPFILKAAEGRA